MSNFDITAGMNTLLSEDEQSALAGKLAEQALLASGGYIWAASVLVQAAAAVLITQMPPRQAAKMVSDLGRFWRQSVEEKLCAKGARQ